MLNSHKQIKNIYIEYECILNYSNSFNLLDYTIIEDLIVYLKLLKNLAKQLSLGVT